MTLVLEKVFKNRNISYLARKLQISNLMNQLKWTIDQLKLSDRYLIVYTVDHHSNSNRSVECVFAITFVVWKGERT